MKIAITASQPNLESQIDPRFGRCPYFLIVDLETMEFKAVDNKNNALASGAGIQSAQLVADQGVEAVITGNCGPKAFATLQAAQIKVVVGTTGTARDLAEQFKKGQLNTTGAPNVNSHFGMQ